jgi:hypothetical protein
MHPKTYLWLQEQDRERMLTERALQRAAREGGEQRPGMARGGISSFTSLLRRAGSAVTNIHFGGTRPTPGLSGESAI